MTTTKTKTTRTKKTAPETPAPVPARPSGVDGIIPCGHRWTSNTGTQCWKVPVETMQTVAFKLPKIDVSQLTDAQLERAANYVQDRYAEKTGEYFVFPVRFEKQADMNTRYWTALNAFSKAVQAERAQRSVSVLFGA